MVKRDPKTGKPTKNYTHGEVEKDIDPNMPIPDAYKFAFGSQLFDNKEATNMHLVQPEGRALIQKRVGGAGNLDGTRNEVNVGPRGTVDTREVDEQRTGEENERLMTEAERIRIDALPVLPYLMNNNPRIQDYNFADARNQTHLHPSWAHSPLANTQAFPIGEYEAHREMTHTGIPGVPNSVRTEGRIGSAGSGHKKEKLGASLPGLRKSQIMNTNTPTNRPL